MLIDDILSRLDNVTPKGDKHICKCPVCGDDHHLYVTLKDDKVLMYCQKCNAEYKDIVPLLNLPKTSKTPEKPKKIEEYDHVYKNPDGSVAYYKTRIKYANMKKDFKFWHLGVDGTKKYTKPDNCNALYNLDLLNKAGQDTTLYIVEGEKCADVMVRKGLLATTSNTGGGINKIKFSSVDDAMLDKFKNKVVIPDNDEVGVQYVRHFRGAKVLDLRTLWPEIMPKGDIYDYITCGRDLNAVINYDFSRPESPGVVSAALTKEDILSEANFKRLLDIKDNFTRTQAVTECIDQARVLGVVNDFKNLFKQYKISVAKKAGQSHSNMTDFEGQPIQLACGEWIAEGSGVRKNEMTNYGDVVVKYASPIPVLPSQILVNLDTGIEKIEIDFFKEGWKSLICERAVAASSTKIIELANKGLEVNSENAKMLVRYIADCVRLNLDILPCVKAVSRLGWIGKKFMPYNQEIIFDGEKENKFLYEAVCQKGNLDTWVNFVSPLRLNIYLRMQMAASFASPLIEKVSALPFVLHTWGLTGSGKTVGLMVAMSIWGNPRMGKMVRTMNMTANSMLSTAAFLNNIPFAGDELQTIKSKWENYDNLIMKITEGIDRGRMSYDRNNELKTWKCAFLFTGEEPCTKSASGGGVKNRVIEIECQHEVVQNGNAVVNFINDNYGHAGKAFIEAIQGQDLMPRYTSIFNDIISNCDTTEKQAMAMALILLADQIATETIFRHEDPLTLDDICEFLTATKDVDIAERAYDFVINFVAKNENKFKAEFNNGEVWGRIENNSFFVNKDVLEKEMEKEGFDFNAVKNKWLQKGYLILNSQKRFIHCTKCLGVKAMYVKILQKEEKPEIVTDYLQSV